MSNGLPRQGESLGDLSVRASLDHERQHLALTRGQSVGVGARGWARAARDGETGGGALTCEDRGRADCADLQQSRVCLCRG